MWLCLYPSVCTPSSAIHRLVSKEDSDTLFTCITYISRLIILRSGPLNCSCWIFLNSALLYCLWWISFYTTLFFNSLGFLEILLFFHDCHRFINHPSRALVFQLAQDLFVVAAVERMIFGIIACVVQMDVLSHVLVNLFCLDFPEQAVNVCVDPLALLPISGFDLVVEAVVHLAVL